MKRLIAVLAALFAALILVACSATSSKPGPTHKPVAPAFGYGASATEIASKIRGCANVAAESIGDGGPDLVSTATCRLQGHLLNVNSWQSDGFAIVQPIIRSDGIETFYTTASGWTVTVGDDPTLQMQFTNDAEGLLRRAFAGQTQAPNDVAGQQLISKMVTQSIGGSVEHFTP